MKYSLVCVQIIILIIGMTNNIQPVATNDTKHSHTYATQFQEIRSNRAALDKLYPLYNKLQSYLQTNPILRQLVSEFSSGSDNDTLGKLLNPLTNILNGTVTFRKVLDSMVNSAEAQQMFKITETTVDTYLERLGVSGSCYYDLKAVVGGVVDGKDWALRMVDAFGKPGSELMNYEIKWLGSYDECHAVKKEDHYNTSPGVTTSQRHFSGKYCTVSVEVGLGNMKIDRAVGKPKIEVGVCVPDTCSAENLQTIIRAVTQNDTGTGTTVTCQQKVEPLDAPAIAAICVLVVLAGFLILGTAYDVIGVQMKQRTQDIQTNRGDTWNINLSVFEKRMLNGEDSLVNYKPERLGPNTLHSSEVCVDKNKAEQLATTSRGMMAKILISFSVYTNGAKILSTHQAAGTLTAVNGIRFLSMAWIILGHTYGVANLEGENIMRFFLDQLYSWPFMGILQADVSVDTFFLLSGLLVAYHTIKELKKVGGIRHFNWFMFYFHRVWRLTPVYALVLMVFATLLKYWPTGPLWTVVHPTFEYCKDIWWSHLLYINNFIHTDRPCMGWTWYLADDMQFYILSPLILLPLFYKVLVGGIVSLLFLVATTLSTALIVMSHHYHVQRGPLAPKPDDSHYGKVAYQPCYTRMGPYIVGLVTGYILYRIKCKCHIPKICVVIGWATCLFVCASVVYGPYTNKDSHIFSLNESVAYHALHRTGWGIAVAWIIFACATGHGGWINELLSWKAFTPLARLTYCAYLIHPIVQVVHLMSRSYLTYLNNYEMIYMFLAILMISYGVAFLTSLAFESPMMGLEKAIFRRDRKET